MTAEQLKNSLLQEAISGRLVPQDPNDESADYLITRIHELRRELFNKGIIKKKDFKVYSISDDEIPFELPNGWCWEKLGNLTTVISDGTHKTPKYTSEGVPFLSVQNISSGKLDLTKIKYIAKTEHLELVKRVNPKRDDILICRIGTLGKAIRVSWDFEFSIFVSLGLIRLIEPSIADYIVRVINSPIGYSWIQENKVGGGTHTYKINLGDLPNMLIPLPPLAEQKRIVAKLEELLPIVEQYGKAQTELDELNFSLPIRLRTSLLQEAMQGKLVPNIEGEEAFTIFNAQIEARKQVEIDAKRLKKSDSVVKPISEEEIPFEIPSNWTWYRLSDLANMYTGDSINAEEKLKFYTNVKGMEYIATKDVKFNHEVDYSNGVAIPDDRRGKFRIAPAGSILLCVEGGSAGRKIATIERDVCFGNKLCCFATYIDISHFLYYYLQSPLFKDVFRNSITGIIGGVAIKTLRDLLVPIPPLEEQKRIVAKLDEILPQIDKLGKL